MFERCSVTNAGTTKKTMTELLRKHSRTISEYSGVLFHRPVAFNPTALLKAPEGFKNINVQIQSPKLNPNIWDESLALII